MVLTL
jgi:xanthine/uracil permease